MNYTIKASSSRDEVEFIDMKEPFQACQLEDLRYAFSVSIAMYDKEKKVAQIFARVFDESAILNAGETMENVANMMDGDIEGAMCELEQSKIFNKDSDIELLICDLYSCYIGTFYINPEYRRQGIAKYLFHNLYNIFLYCFNVHIHCFVTYPRPQVPIKEGDDVTLINAPDEDGSMKHLMVSVIRKAGYKEIKKSGFFAVNCATEEAVTERKKESLNLTTKQQAS